MDIIEIKKGTFLALGTGSGTQAIKLFERGLDVTASDMSTTSIHKASVRYNEKINKKIKFIADDIPNSHLSKNEVTIIFDRGCFHVVSP